MVVNGGPPCRQPALLPARNKPAVCHQRFLPRLDKHGVAAIVRSLAPPCRLATSATFDWFRAHAPGSRRSFASTTNGPAGSRLAMSTTPVRFHDQSCSSAAWMAAQT